MTLRLRLHKAALLTIWRCFARAFDSGEHVAPIPGASSGDRRKSPYLSWIGSTHAPDSDAARAVASIYTGQLQCTQVTAQFVLIWSPRNPLRSQWPPSQIRCPHRD
ncbi:hypothetical protein DAEQUDRAFT_109242 [Daedalea quercina L-15889]|uniref:Secreted protein n=1 Tax=Daedalea quercina L-15889 TaxID=1314783 RepID=A0A165S454_9APHY|nr:hypothetical protein DAEQUDRAFT_109242 [Daedalea quercina L-15889]